MDTKVIIKNCRFSYAYVFEKDNNDKYSVALLIRKDDPQVEQIKAAIKAAAEAGSGKLGPNFKLKVLDVLHDGDDKEAPEYEGCYYLNAKSNNKPSVVKKNNTGMGDTKTVEITDPSEFYSGCYGGASVNFYAFNSGTNKGVACGLNALIKLRDGDFLGSKASAEADLGGLVDDDDDIE